MIEIEANLVGTRIVLTCSIDWGTFNASYPGALSGAQYDASERVYTVARFAWSGIFDRLCALVANEPILDIGIDPKIAAWVEEEKHIVVKLETEALARVEVFDRQLAKRGWTVRPYQREGIRWLSSRRGGLLCDQMGLGKSIQALGAAPQGVPILIVCPASLRRFWKEEVERWRPDLCPLLVEGKEAFRWPMIHEYISYLGIDLRPRVECLIMSESVFTDSFVPPERSVYLIADEAHVFKGETSKRAKRMRDLCTVIRDNGGWTVGLTGTPLLNEPGELYRVCQVFGIEREAWDNWPSFRRLFGGVEDRWGKTYWSRNILPEARERFSRVALRRMQRDVLPDLPPISYREIPISLPDKILKTLDGLSVEMNDALNDWEWHNVMPDFEHHSKVKAELSALKLKAALEIVKDFEDAREAVLVFSAHRAVIDGLAKRQGWATITGDTSPNSRQSIVDKFQMDGYHGLAMTIRAGGVGFNLTNASHVLMVDRDYTPGMNAQAIARAWRSGQKNPVLVTDLIADHPLERRIHKINRQKQEMMETI